MSRRRRVHASVPPRPALSALAAAMGLAVVLAACGSAGSSPGGSRPVTAGSLTPGVQHLYWADNGPGGTTIGGASLDGTGFVPSLIAGLQRPCGVATDAAHLYWVEETGSSVGRANLDGSDVQTGFIKRGPGMACGVAVDATHVYWANGGSTGVISRANLDGSSPDQGFIKARGWTCGVAVDAGHVYWGQWDGSTIGRAALDGSDVQPDFITGASKPCGVAVDAGHVYWANTGGGSIGRAALDGSGADQAFVKAAGGGPCGVGVDASNVYWGVGTDTSGGSIGRAAIDGSGANPTFLTAGPGPCGAAIGK